METFLIHALIGDSSQCIANRPCSTSSGLTNTDCLTPREFSIRKSQYSIITIGIYRTAILTNDIVTSRHKGFRRINLLGGCIPSR